MASPRRRRRGWLPVGGALLSVGALVLGAGACSGEKESLPVAAQEEDLTTVVIPIEGMSCSACAARVKKALRSIDGVAEVEVSLVDRNARVRFASSQLSADRLVAAVNGLGYRASPPTEAR